MKQEMTGWQWHQLDYVCKSFTPHFRQITVPELHHSVFTGRMLFLWRAGPLPDHLSGSPTSGAPLCGLTGSPTTSSDAPRQERPSGAEADRSGV